jgi:hypothetical protein
MRTSWIVLWVACLLTCSFVTASGSSTTISVHLVRPRLRKQEWKIRLFIKYFASPTTKILYCLPYIAIFFIGRYICICIACRLIIYCLFRRGGGNNYGNIVEQAVRTANGPLVLLPSYLAINTYYSGQTIDYLRWVDFTCVVSASIIYLLMFLRKPPLLLNSSYVHPQVQQTGS